MNLPRFFVPQCSSQGEIELPESEAHHVAKVLRLQVDDQIELFDGKGSRAIAKLSHVSKNRVMALAGSLQRTEVQRELNLQVAVSLPKGDRQKWLVEKLTELGVDGLIPLQTERGVAQPTDNALQRLERVTLEACKQSRRDRLVEILQPASLREIVTSRVDGENRVLLIAHPYPAEATDTASCHKGSAALRTIQWPLHSGQIVLAIGPEGGFTEGEIQEAIGQGWKLWTFGDYILRVETAVIVGSTILLDFLSSRSSLPSLNPSSP
ncbi:MAG: Ribosomal small subunit methyltransferase [Planctomycetota bacterium]|jgi:16S rRNA (uracil1498-N3)-methyltransferase